jgi:hypothetical protein
MVVHAKVAREEDDCRARAHGAARAGFEARSRGKASTSDRVTGTSRVFSTTEEMEGEWASSDGFFSA